MYAGRIRAGAGGDGRKAGATYECGARGRYATNARVPEIFDEFSVTQDPTTRSAATDPGLFATVHGPRLSEERIGGDER